MAAAALDNGFIGTGTITVAMVTGLCAARPPRAWP